ncbi:glucose 1-dehydrogenase [Fodinisporobacter ferrooxydans]|uniref:Glucose 1-dehydrogenase n=1 Tax=Fodinisporobacter ferrooxydans TaxID=2901836 RepID=A0ABY4CPD1_9BACL|nr:glucose 1-dehydrogenase [Alicyclobacillaceae bacterium MYW30-H2]
MEIFRLKDRVAVVTGGNKGLGRAMALGLARAGADVVVIGRDENSNQQVVDEIRELGRKATSYSIDLRNTTSIHNTMDEISKTFTKIDILVNNAGSSFTKFALEVTEEEWDQILHLNLKSLFFCCQAAAKKMVEQGHGKIINIASIAGAVGEVGISAYTASKAAVINLTKSLALEWARYNIQVNAIGPAYIKTDLNAKQLENPKVYEKIISKTPMKRLGQPEELVGTAVLLASDASSFITGQTIFVDGGWLAQ